jgi:hypothetical protein
MFPVHLEVLEQYHPIIMPLTYVEVELYIIPFVDNLENQVGSPVKQNPKKRKQPEIVVPAKDKQSVKSFSQPLNIDWKEIFKSDRPINFNDPSMK